MRKRVGTKLYDTDKAVLVKTESDGIQVYRKKNSPQFFVYNPNGKTGAEMFFEIPPEETGRYLAVKDNTKVRDSYCKIQFSEHDHSRIRVLSTKLGMSMAKFVMMLVNEYEKRMLK